MSTPEDTSTAARRWQGRPVYADYYGLMPGDQEVVASVRASMSIPFFFLFGRGAQAATGFIIRHAAAGHLPRGR